jgi:YVTN family beta-propeller protein
MKRGQYLSAMMVVLLTALLAGCGGSSTVATTVTISPSAAVVVLGGTQQFTASVNGPSDTTVTWSISGSSCSGDGCGTVTSSGLYTAPAQIFSPNTVTVTATSNADSKASANASVTLDSGVRVQMTPAKPTIATNEKITFTATVTGTSNTQVTWQVNAVDNGDATDGLICLVGSDPCAAPTGPVNTVYYLAPANVPSAGNVTVTASSVADSTKVSNNTVTILAAVDPVVASISPSTAAQGSVTQDVYVNAESPSNFFATSMVLANGSPIPTTFINTTLLRGRIPTGILQSAGTVQIAVQAQNGHTSNSIGINVGPVRPAIISYSPISVPQCASGSCGPASVTLDGGYFSPSTVVQFNGQTVGATLKSSNQMSVALPGSALQNAGLYQLTLTNPGATRPEAAVNVAVEPDVAANPPAVTATVGVGTQPAAAAINPATGAVAIADTASDSISVFNLNNCNSSSCPVTSIPVGKQPTGLTIDSLRNLAIVVNQGDNTLSLVDLSGTNPTQTLDLPPSYVPVSVGENPLTQHALVANKETNTVTVVDLSQTPAVMTSVDVTQGGTRSGGTGAHPRVVVEPRLDWAVVTPGGNGAISAIDMSHPTISTTTGSPTFQIVFSFTLDPSVTGIALNPDTDQLLLTDTNGSTATIFSLLDESTRAVLSAGFDNIAAAVNPLTNVGVLANQQTNSVSLVDMTNSVLLGSPVTVGNAPIDVVMDPTTDEAVVVNQADGTASVVSLGGVRPLSIAQTSPSRLFTSTSAQTLTVVGGGFTSGSLVRIDGTPLATSAVQMVSSRELKVSVPASMLSGPKILNLDVQNPDGTVSSISQVSVVQAVSVGTSPIAVAIDSGRNLAVVTNSVSNTVSLVDLGSGQVTATINVGANPQAVSVISRLGKAVVANTGDNTASVVDLTNQTATSISLSASAGSAQGPISVDINQDAGVAAIANQLSDNVSLLDLNTNFLNAQFRVDQGPLGIAIDPQLGLAAVLCASQSPSTIDIANLNESPPFLTAHISGANLPIGVVLDPVNDLFLVADSSGNRILVVDPQTSKIVQNVATGINPTAIAYNHQALEALTANASSHTASVLEMSPAGSHVRALLSVDGSSQQSVAINPLTNLAVVVDQANNRVLLVPLPH